MNTPEDYLKKVKRHTPTGNADLDAKIKGLVEIRKWIDGPSTASDAEHALRIEEAIELGARRKFKLMNFRTEEKVLYQAVRFEPKFKNEVYEEFSKHFEKQDRRFLKELILNNNYIERSIRFNGSCKKLVEFFKRVKYNDLLSCKSNTILAEWVFHYFQYKHTGRYKNFNKTTVEAILKSTDKEGNSENPFLGDKVTFHPSEDRPKIQAPK